MTTSPSDLMKFVEPSTLTKKPYTNLEPTNWNMKMRQVYCTRCIYRTETPLPDPRCGYCDGPLYTVVKSSITEEMLTNELGRGNSNSAQ